MRIVHDTSDLIVIEDRPWALGLFLIAVMLFSAYVGLVHLATGDWVVLAAVALLGGGAFWWFSRDIRLVRLTLAGDGSARLTVRGFRGNLARDFAPGTLRASVQTDRSGDGEGYRVVLLVDGADGPERLPFTGYFTGGPAPERIAARIHDWRSRHPA